MERFNPDAVTINPAKQKFEDSFSKLKNINNSDLSIIGNLTDDYLAERIELFNKFIQHTIRHLTESIDSKNTNTEQVQNALKQIFNDSVAKYNTVNSLSEQDKAQVDKVTLSCWEDELKAEVESTLRNYFSVVDDYAKAEEVLDVAKQISKDEQLFLTSVVRFLERKTRSGGFYLGDERNKPLGEHEVQDLINFMNKKDLWSCFDKKLNSDDAMRAYSIFKILMNKARENPSILEKL